MDKQDEKQTTYYDEKFQEQCYKHLYTCGSSIIQILIDYYSDNKKKPTTSYSTSNTVPTIPLYMLLVLNQHHFLVCVFTSAAAAQQIKVKERTPRTQTGTNGDRQTLRKCRISQTTPNLSTNWLWDVWCSGRGDHRPQFFFLSPFPTRIAAFLQLDLIQFSIKK